MRKFLLILALILILTALTGSAVPAGKVTAIGSTSIKKSVLASSGGSSEIGDVQINATLGQPIIGSAQESDSTLISGFWDWVQQAVDEFLNFLPLIFR